MKLHFKTCLIVALGVWGAMLSPSAPGQTPEGDAAIVKREFGTAIKEMEAFEKEVQDAKPAEYPKIEARLIAIVESPEATMPGKQFACQMLRTVGSPKCVPAVSKLLTDEKLSHIARYVLLGMPGSAAEDTLRKALGQTEGNLRIGIINTIGDRGDRKSLQAVAALLKDNDEATSRSALNAIGKIGGTQAADALAKAKVAASLQEAWAHAYLRCAGSLGESSRAEKMYQSLLDGDYPSAIRGAALPAIAQAQKERAVPLIVKLFFSDDAILQRAAASAVTTVPGNAATRAFVQAMTPENRPALVEALAIRGDPVGVTASVNIMAMIDHGSSDRAAAIKVLGRLGDATSIPVLAGALKDGGTLGADAGKALTELQGDGVAAALLKQSETGDVAVREAMLKVLADRGQVESLPAFRKAVNDPDPKIRRAALKALAALGTREDLVKLVDTLAAAKDDSERGQIAGAISDIGARMTDTTARCEPVLQALAKADPPTKVALLGVLSGWGGDKALQAARTSLSGDAEVRKAAVKALAEWPDAAPMPDLLAVAKDGKEKSEQIVALRGFIRMAGLETGKARLQAYRDAMEVATRPEEKWLVLAGLAGVTQVESLKMVEASLEDAALQREAFAAYEKIAESLASRQPAVAKEALDRVVEKASDNSLRNKAKAALAKMNK